MRLLIVVILFVGAAFVSPPVTLFEDGSYRTISGHNGCLPFGICNEGE
jgi:hypothetical protein